MTALLHRRRLTILSSRCLSLNEPLLLSSNLVFRNAGQRWMTTPPLYISALRWNGTVADPSHGKLGRVQSSFLIKRQTNTLLGSRERYWIELSMLQRQTLGLAGRRLSTSTKISMQYTDEESEVNLSHNTNAKLERNSILPDEDTCVLQYVPSATALDITQNVRSSETMTTRDDSQENKCQAIPEREREILHQEQTETSTVQSFPTHVENTTDEAAQISTKDAVSMTERPNQPTAELSKHTKLDNNDDATNDTENTVRVSNDQAHDHLANPNNLEDDNYVIQHVSPVTALDVVKNLWSSQLSLESDVSENANHTVSQQYLKERLPLQQSPADVAQTTLDMAQIWINNFTFTNRQSKRTLAKPFECTTLPHTLSAVDLEEGKLHLASLAKARQQLGLRGSEPAARQILTILSSLGNSRLDADVFAHFLLCIEGNDKQEIAVRAEQFVLAMMGKAKVDGFIENTEMDNGFVLPKPNINVVNALIQIWAQLGGSSGRYGPLLQELFPPKGDVLPNRDSFTALLSSCCYPAVVEDEVGGFDKKFAQKCIDGLRELAKQENDATLYPDTYVYNVPIQWNESTSVQPDLDFWIKEESDVKLKQAKVIEDWVKQMAGSSDDRILPNVDSYEAIIQAFLQTRTRKGLVKAHSIAKKLIQNTVNNSSISVRPRLYTFRPLFEAWLRSGYHDALLKIEELALLLEIVSTQNPSMKHVAPDGRIRISQMAALLQKQHIKLPSADNLKSAKNIVNLAGQCSTLLNTMCDELERCAVEELVNFLEVTLFEQTLCAWANAALAGVHSRSSQYVMSSINEMHQTLEAFEKCSHVLSKSTSIEGADENLDQAIKSHQFYHFVVNSFRLYSLFFHNYRIINESRQKSAGHNIEPSDDTVQVIKKIVMRTTEFFLVTKIHGLQDSFDSSKKSSCAYSKVFYEDSFECTSFSYDSSELASSYQEFLELLFVLLRESELTPNQCSDLLPVLSRCKGVIESEGSSSEVLANFADVTQFLRQRALAED